MTAREIDGPLAALCEELRVLARARSPLAVTPGSLPALEALAETGLGAGDLDAVHALVVQATKTLPRREAAAVVLLFADDDDRWQRNLTERMTLAGAELGFRYDTFRRRSGSDRPDSHYDVLLALLAEAIFEAAIAGPADATAVGSPMVDVEPPADSGDGSRDAAAPAASDASNDRVASPSPTEPGIAPAEARRSGRVLVGLAAALLAVVAAVAAIAVFASNGDEVAEPVPAGGAAMGSDESAIAGADGAPATMPEDEPEAPDRTLDVLESVPVEGCDVPLGGSMNPVALPDGLEALVAGTYAVAGGFDALGCPLRTVELWDQLWYQEFAGGELPVGRILADPVGDVAVWIDEAMFFHYERSGGGNLQTLGGLPVGTDYDSPHPLLLLSGGGAMVAHYLGGPAHWVPVEGIAVWNELGGADGALGLPMADVNFFDGRPGQEWSGGYGELGDDGTISLDLVDADEIAAAVAALPRRSEGILRLYDDTAYWIDDQGRRRWIPDGETWACLGGADALIEPETPGWVVGAFPAGPNATCP
ncbi:MAG: hypothetical protein ACE367_10470 [Acidimicrobiales bacterium]